MAGSTHIPSTNTAGKQLAIKHYNAALFQQILGKAAMGDLGRLEGPAPDAKTFNALVKGTASYDETPRTMPGVRITNLQKMKGDEVSVSIVHPASGRPTMGDREIEGRFATTTFATHSLKLNQMRLGHDPGGEMTQQRTDHDLRKIGRTQVLDMAVRTIDQVRLVHCAGDRGEDTQKAWMVPLASDSEFAEIMVNDVRRPSYNRHFYAAGAADVTELDSTAILTLDDISRIRAIIDEMETPMLPVTLPGDDDAGNDPLYIMRVTPRQWHHLKTYHDGRGRDWQTFMSAARERNSSNPLFKGSNVGIWNGILVRKGLLPIGWNQGSTMTVTTSAATYTTTTKTVPTFDADAAVASDHRVERALVFGGQAWVSLYGKDSNTEMPTRWHEEMADMGNRFRCSLSGMCGFSKLSYLDEDGVHTDHGVLAYDTYAPKATGRSIELYAA